MSNQVLVEKGGLTVETEWGRVMYIPFDLVEEPGLPPEAKWTYVILRSLCPQGSRRCAVRQHDLLQRTGIRSVHTLRRYLARLVSAGWIRVDLHRGRQVSAYEVLNPHEAARAAAIERIRVRLQREAFKGEAIMKEWLNLLVATDDYQDNARPSFLINPGSGERLEYDRLYTEAGVAFEFNGPQHYQPTEVYADPNQVRAQKTRDVIKLGLSARAGVTLVVIHPGDLTLPGMRARIPPVLPTRDVPADHPVVRFLSAVSRRYRAKIGVAARRDSLEA